MTLFNEYIGYEISLELFGSGTHTGILIDAGPDAIVLKKDNEYMYIATKHIHFIESLSGGASGDLNADRSHESHLTGIPLSRIVSNAIGVPSQIKLDRHQYLYGTVTSVYDDYFEFASVSQGLLYVSLVHLKWIRPLPEDQQWFQPPANTEHDSAPASPSTFSEWLLSAQGSSIIIDSGTAPHKFGHLQQSDYPFLKLLTADNKTIRYNAEHIKCVNLLEKPAPA
ncbi:hypothetical protein [Paenibacillus sp. NEAU-GSW1]|uniref:hypothetical protein n=1 Tax=Paenibacillus sp. NEAU-GSW1 TaxID=2682486 RepID=UPI0012E2A868|nr:hypothetical protein [Paenibacillus sp. NEAU-GSW1]MUT67138.1 hypothetical protein [Paenibacillus sp. NEAU-GSW1]